MANAYKYAGPKKTQNCIGPDPTGPVDKTETRYYENGVWHYPKGKPGTVMPGMRHDPECLCDRCKNAMVNGWFKPKRP